MQDSIVIFGGTFLACFFSQISPDIGIPSWVQSVTPIGILGFVVWFTMTQINTSLKENNISLRDLREEFKDLRTEMEKEHKS